MFLLLFFLWYLVGSYLGTFYAYCFMLGDNFASYFTEVTDTACPYPHFFSLFHYSIGQWYYSLKAEILIASHQSLPTRFTISLISEEQEHLTLYTCALCSNNLSLSSSLRISIVIPTPPRDENLWVRDFSLTLHKVFWNSGYFFHCAYCPLTFWNIFWFIFQRETFH